MGCERNGSFIASYGVLIPICNGSENKAVRMRLLGAEDASNAVTASIANWNYSIYNPPFTCSVTPVM